MAKTRHEVISRNHVIPNIDTFTFWPNGAGLPITGSYGVSGSIGPLSTANPGAAGQLLNTSSPATGSLVPDTGERTGTVTRSGVGAFIVALNDVSKVPLFVAASLVQPAASGTQYAVQVTSFNPACPSGVNGIPASGTIDLSIVAVSGSNQVATDLTPNQAAVTLCWITDLSAVR